MSGEFDITTCPEAILYFYIETLGGVLWRLRHDSADGRIPIDFKTERELQEKIEKAVDQTVRFGVTQPRDKNRASDEYWKWYRWLNTWHHGMSDEEWQEVERKSLTPRGSGKT